MEVKRATFEHVQTSQDTFFFDLIKKLEEEKETVDPTARPDYFKILADAFLGVEKGYKFILYLNGNEYNFGSLSSYARKLGYITDADLNEKKEVILHNKGNLILVPIQNLWKSLRECLYDPTAEALTLSLKTSAELITREGGVYEFKVDQNIETGR